MVELAGQAGAGLEQRFEIAQDPCVAAAAIIIPQVTRRLSHRSRTDIGEVGGSRRATVDAG